jgi:hypothetical protein
MGDMESTGTLNRLAVMSRVSIPVLTALINGAHYRYVWVHDGGHVEFSDLFTETEWAAKVSVSFVSHGEILVLRRRLGPYVKTDKEGRWILQEERNLLESGNALEKAVVHACNNAMENGFEETLTSPALEDIAIDLMDNDADIEKLTAHDDSKFTQDDVIQAIKKWRVNHTWEDFTKMPA